MPAKSHTLFQLHQIASIDLQAIAQTARQMSDDDARSYLDMIASGLKTLGKVSEEKRQ